MNEKIKQLADQARVVADEFQEQWKAGPSNEEFFQEKFAELLIRACADLFEVEYGQSEVSGNEVARVLKEHFGVEDRAIPILSDDEETLFAGIASSKLFTIAAVKKAFGVKE